MQEPCGAIANRPLLFRYRPLGDDLGCSLTRREFSALDKSYFYSSPFEHLNDPGEAIAEVKYSSAHFLDKLEEGAVEKIEKQKELCENYRNSRRIVSFSLDLASYPMWAHYAGNFSGMCLCFDYNKIADLCDVDDHLIKVEYRNAPSPPIEIDFVEDWKKELISRLSQKGKAWCSELEVRMITAQEKWSYTTDALIAIYVISHKSNSSPKGPCQPQINPRVLAGLRDLVGEGKIIEMDPKQWKLYSYI